ncbi:uncharacterized protein LOC142580028 isoform X2 [Dermacentor variabilis]|uniref:uncharacterized protein LOC142580028 isoform X2 n=1 Tax=Dermacentor variabilis TaxID=34621 RepID=UPI003F5BAFE1
MTNAYMGRFTLSALLLCIGGRPAYGRTLYANSKMEDLYTVTKHAPEIEIQMRFRELQHKHSCTEFYTDASKSREGVPYAAVGPSFSESDLLYSETSIFTDDAPLTKTMMCYEPKGGCGLFTYFVPPLTERKPWISACVKFEALRSARAKSQCFRSIWTPMCFKL